MFSKKAKNGQCDIGNISPSLSFKKSFDIHPYRDGNVRLPLIYSPTSFLFHNQYIYISKFKSVNILTIL